jgi:hypothetical protein
MGNFGSTPHPEKYTFDSRATDEIIENVNLDPSRFNVCDLSKNFVNLKVLQKTSTSVSVILLGDLIEHSKRASSRDVLYFIPVALKIFYPPPDPQLNNSLKTEATIYEYLTKNLYLKKHTPHLIRHIAHLTCTDIKGMIDNISQDETLKKQLTSALLKLKNDTNFDLRAFGSAIQDKGVQTTDPLTVLAVEQALNSKTGYAFLEFFIDNPSTPMPPNILKILVFQILWTLECFNRIGMRHNDLHMNNFFVQLYNPDEANYNYSYTLPDGKTFYFTTVPFSVKIFDFDRSNIEGVTDNTLLSRGNPSELCNKIGICRGPNPKYDTLKFLCTLYTWLEEERKSNPEFDQFIETNISKDLFTYLQQNAAKNKRIDECVLLSADGGDFIPPDFPSFPVDQVPKGIYMNSTLKMLSSPYFDKFTTTKEENVEYMNFVLPS